MNGPHILVVGNVNVDMIMGPQAPWPTPGTEVVLADYELRPGGQAGNSALALAGLGVPYRIHASAGDDALGRWLRDCFGEPAAHWRLANRPTTVSVGITHPNGERTFFTNRGHLEVFGPDDVLPHLGGNAKAGSVALLVGAFLSPPMVDGFPALLCATQAAGYRTAVDPGWPPGGWTEDIRASFRAWLARTDILLVNEVEALALSGAADLTAAAAALRPLLPAEATLVIKRGAEGASAWSGGMEVALAPPAVSVVDSIGAGDVFNAGFLAEVMAGAGLDTAVRAGVVLASRVIATSPRRYALD